MEKVDWEQYQIILKNEVMDCEMLCWNGEKCEQLWEGYI